MLIQFLLLALSVNASGPSLQYFDYNAPRPTKEQLDHACSTQHKDYEFYAFQSMVEDNPEVPNAITIRCEPKSKWGKIQNALTVSKVAFLPHAVIEATLPKLLKGECEERFGLEYHYLKYVSLLDAGRKKYRVTCINKTYKDSEGVEEVSAETLLRKTEPQSSDQTPLQ